MSVLVSCFDNFFRAQRWIAPVVIYKLSPYVRYQLYPCDTHLKISQHNIVSPLEVLQSCYEINSERNGMGILLSIQAADMHYLYSASYITFNVLSSIVTALNDRFDIVGLQKTMFNELLNGVQE